MVPTIIYKNASNWVDRGEPANIKIQQALSHFFERFDETYEPWLAEQATILFGMVSAEATEVQIASYVRQVARGIAGTGTGVKRRVCRRVTGQK